ncbi:MAG TPA: hypothetical protein VJ715_06405 [Pyrinomonadaceae bacterium]|nr:hypothetical protein [Pyrinomonadaceae bacterium]
MTLTLIILCVVAPCPKASARSANFKSNRQGRTPTASQVIERFIRAIGGRAAWLRIKTQYTAGTIEVTTTGGKGTYEAYLKAPAKSLVIIRLAGTEFKSGFDGQMSWNQSQQNAAQYDPPAKQATSRRDSDFYKYLNFRQHFRNARVTGIEEVEGAQAYVVEATRFGEKLPEKLYFNVRSGILVRRDTSSENSKGKITTDIQYYDDYREIDGIKLAYGQRAIQSDMTIVMKHTEVKNNLAISDAIFNLPKN